MDSFLAVLIPGVLGFALLRLMALPLKLAAKAAIHAGAGFFSLWLLNLVGGITGICFPVNLATILTAGILGLPGIGVLALCSVVP